MTLTAELKRANIIVKGKFKLTSGNTADFYCDFKKVYENPKLFRRVVGVLSKKIKGKVTCIAATGHGGIPLATLVSNKLNLPLTLIRGEKRTHGLKKKVEGYIPSVKDYVTVIDDVCTYGTSLMKAINVLKRKKAKINACYVVILRSEMKLPFKYPLYYLTKAEELLR